MFHKMYRLERLRLQEMELLKTSFKIEDLQESGMDLLSIVAGIDDDADELI